MNFKLSFDVNETVYLKDPEKSELGKKLIKHSIDLIAQIGFEAFTFKKLAADVATTEASVYRYFENKHRLLLYIVSWYWKYMDFLLDYQLQNIADPKQKIKCIISLFSHELPSSMGGLDYNKQLLHQIVIAEGSKVYLTKEVASINQNEVFSPYKDLCAKIASVISAYNKKYPYPKSLSTTIIEVSHQQQFFSVFLPRLTDVTSKNKNILVNNFLEDLVFKTIG